MAFTKFTLNGSTYAIVRRRDIVTLRSGRDVDRVLRAIEEERGGGALRRLAELAAGSVLVSDADEVRRLVAKLLSDGDLAMVRLEEPVRRLDAPRMIHAPVRPSPAAPAPPVDAITDWVALRLVDADGEPVADEPYELELPDGTKIPGRTDAEGRARHEGVPRGSCRISFPQVWSSEWRASGEVIPAPEATSSAAGATTTDANQPSSATSDGADEPPHPPSHLVSEPDDPPAPGHTWIVLEVEDSDRRSVRGATIAIELPSGEVVERELDDLGRVELIDIPDGGRCRATLRSEALRLPPATYATGAAYLVIAERTGRASA